MITLKKKFSHFVIVVSGPDYNFHLRKFEGNDLQLTLIYKLSLVIYINITDIYFSVFIYRGGGGGDEEFWPCANPFMLDF